MRQDCDNCEAFEEMTHRVTAGDGLELFACSEACAIVLDWQDATVEEIPSDYDPSEKEREDDGESDT